MRKEYTHKCLAQLPIILALIFVGLNLRPSMAAIGPLLPHIRDTIPLSFTLISLLTMLPVLAMGLAMFVGTYIVKKFGAFRVVTAALIVIGVSNFFRLYANSIESLLITAVVAGCGIAVIQAVLPSLVKKEFPQAIALYMGIYVTAIMGGAALAASLASYVNDLSGSWQVALACWFLLAVLALVFWISIRGIFNDDISQIEATKQTFHFYQIPRAWQLGLFFGLGTASYTCVLAWLPPYYIEQGWSSNKAGLLLAFLTGMEVLAGLLFPALANRTLDRRFVLSGVLVLIVIGYLGLIFSPTLPAILWASLLGLGIGGLFPMSLIVTMDHYSDPQMAGELTAFVQGVGYLIAAFSPLIAGVIRDYTNSFIVAWIILLIITTSLLLMAYLFKPQQYTSKMRLS